MSGKQYTKDALTILKETSRTFFVPISKLNGDPKDAVASAYLCLRAIDEIEDHEKIANKDKVKLLRNVSMKLQEYRADSTAEQLTPEWEGFESQLPEVSLRIGEWILYCPEAMRGRIVDATSAMSDRMANWADRDFQINTVQDLDGYTFSVAGSVGLLLSDIWAHYDQCITDRSLAVGFGRGLQSVNILRNKLEDKVRGVEWYPKGFTNTEMFEYAERNLAFAKLYMKSLPKGSSALLFCRIPLNLALATISALKKGKEKLSREEVVQICNEAEDDNKAEGQDQDFIVNSIKQVDQDQQKYKQQLNGQEA
ncbi:Terpenoid synthase [Pseudocohnilembus persalinus]|uniref:Terpenoid synthase n=1 Tax=Pseudocohnilembus persalinus TaxID=266149 RepID=A0A0V0QC41_PSEPJ|nr:Terpenoid synthase [Pseudocohnilembus persalinus]|eukprot:KRW99795.1 Terpenoid synthase [Pseudocohnilembus persalinus]